MSHGLITTEWADGIYSFRLRYGEIRELQSKCGDVGPLRIFNSLLNSEWKVEHIREILRLGLIGGGLEPVAALGLCKTYVEERSPLENVALALEILGAWLRIPSGEVAPMGEARAAKTDSLESTSPPSTETRQ